jgi:hypothetical protein
VASWTANLVSSAAAEVASAAASVTFAAAIVAADAASGAVAGTHAAAALNDPITINDTNTIALDLIADLPC